jgi:hypothetical protein
VGTLTNWSLVYVCFYLTTSHSLPLFGGKAHSNCGPDVSSAPPCPASGSLVLDDTYPVTSATVSAAQGVKFAYDFTVKAMFAQNPPFPVVISANEADFREILSRIKTHSGLTADQKKRAISLLKRIDPNRESSAENWQQDFVQAQFNPNSGLPFLREVANYAVEGSLRETYVAEIADRLKHCGVSQGTNIGVENHPSYFANGMGGGNIESLPNGICLLGRNSFDTDEKYRSYAQNACGKTYLEAPTDFLDVGHTDEIMNVVMDNSQPSPCNYAVTMASPRKALDLLKQNPQVALFSESMLTAMAEIKGTDRTLSISLCEKITRKKFLSNWSSQRKGQTPDHGTRPKGTAFLNLIYFSIKAARATAIHLSEEEYRYLDRQRVKIRKKISANPQAECSSLRNSDLLQYILQDDYDDEMEQKPSELKLANEAIQKKLDSFKEQILQRTKSHSPSCSPEIIDVPYLFSAQYLSEKKDNPVVGAQSLFPNSTNGVRIGETYLFPSPGNKVFGDYTEEQYRNRGAKVDYIDTYWAHSRKGNLHCSTQVLRHCKPRTAYEQ